MTKALYPLKFETIYKDKIWGGQKIHTVLRKDFSPLPNCGETWELSGVPGNISKASNGPFSGQLITELIQSYGEDLMGKRVLSEFGNEFPLLIKFIDAAADLSIQVHPGDELASERHQSKGKSEMWYILQADDGAKLISGFNQEMSPERFEEVNNEGKLMEVLNQETVHAHDVFYLPAGRVHTIGKGLLLAEIQQTSDVTYRIYDFERTDGSGKKRELHLEEAIDAIDYHYYDNYKTPYEDKYDQTSPLVKSPYFITNKLHLTTDYDCDRQNLDCFKIYICIEGQGSLMYSGGKETIQLGEVVLVPACMEKYTFETSSGLTLLETYIPK